MPIRGDELAAGFHSTHREHDSRRKGSEGAARPTNLKTSKRLCLLSSTALTAIADSGTEDQYLNLRCLVTTWFRDDL